MGEDRARDAPVQKPITVAIRLEPQKWVSLRGEAQKLGKTTGQLAQSIIDAYLREVSDNGGGNVDGIGNPGTGIHD